MGGVFTLLLLMGLVSLVYGVFSVLEHFYGDMENWNIMKFFYDEM